LAALFAKEIRISSGFNEYQDLMSFLTLSGTNILDMIDSSESRFQEILENIYVEKNTKHFKEILVFLKQRYSEQARKLLRAC